MLGSKLFDIPSYILCRCVKLDCFPDSVSTRRRGSLYIAVKNAELQIRGGIDDNSKIIFLFRDENICCDPSLEPSSLEPSR